MPSIIVFGARNLGGAILEHFLAAGWGAAGIARSSETLSAIRSRGAVALEADASDPEQVRHALARARETLGDLDVIVNAVSVARFDPSVPWGGGPIVEATLERHRAWATAVTEQAVVCLSESARALIDQGRPATFVQVANSSSRKAAQGVGLWAAGWHGVRALTLAAADELRARAIHVALLVVDGPIDSPKTRAQIAELPANATNAQAEVAAAVAYLARQGERGRTNELTLTPAGQSPAAW
jgi:NAD(P)-dependent dehydrogenase (short-subunit alcohol dehydrogenase family)